MTFPEIVLYHYGYSPYARRIVWYLALRGIPYKQCLQPPMLPRPDVARLGVAYRRIPILSIGKDIYLDTRLQLVKLEELAHSTPRLGATSAADRAVERLLAHMMTEGGVFRTAVSLLPTSLPMLRDARYFADRSDFLGARLSREGMERGRPEAEVEIVRAFEVLEGLLADGREWVLGGDGEYGPGMADIEGVWVAHWLSGIPGALPGTVSGERFPRVWAWMGRFQARVSAAKRAGGAPVEVSGEEAAALIEGSAWHEDLGPDLDSEDGAAAAAGLVDAGDPVVRAEGLARGDGVVVWPTDTGRGHRERGRLVRMDREEVVVEVRTGRGVRVRVRVHAPRQGYRVKKAAGTRL